MKKRATAGVLWFFSVWYAWSILAMFIGVSNAPAPLFGAFAALLIAGDPFGRIWTNRAVQNRGRTAPSADLA